MGVVAAITPWNFPARDDHPQGRTCTRRRLHRGAASRLETPLIALALAELAERAGIPTGVLNVLTGKASAIGKELHRQPAVRMLTFTGSTEIGAC